jgi:fatty acid desaturase
LATTSVSFVTWLVTLLLFLALRGGFGGVPPMVAGYGRRRDAVTSSAGEIAAFLVAALIAMVLVWVFTVFVLAGIYTSLRQTGQMMWVLPVSLGVSAVSAVVFFLIFIATRGAMPGAAAADGPLETCDDGGASI